MPMFNEARQWERRTGRFRHMDRDTEDRKQVMPGLMPSVTRQTHNLLEQEGGEYHDGPESDMDS